MELSEERKNQACKCENCMHEPLKHFEKCPKCGSEGYHTTIFSPKQENTENKGNMKGG